MTDYCCPVCENSRDLWVDAHLRDVDSYARIALRKRKSKPPWTDDSRAGCNLCGYRGKVRDFDESGKPYFRFRCPKCKRPHTIWAWVCSPPTWDEARIPLEEGPNEQLWAENTAAGCECGYRGKVKDFDKKEVTQ